MSMISSAELSLKCNLKLVEASGTLSYYLLSDLSNSVRLSVNIVTIW